MKSRLEMVKDGLYGRLTEEEKQYYINNYMDNFEQMIGKPFFEMNNEEDLQYNVYTYNAEPGFLEDYDCPKCLNKGRIATIGNNLMTISQCSCMAIRKSVDRIRRSGLSDLLDIYNFDKYKCEETWQQVVKDKAQSFVESDASLFMISGTTGSGKSMICTSISKELLNKCFDLKYMVWTTESLSLKQYKLNDIDKYNKLMDEIKNIDVLYIDDFLKVGKNEEPTTADMNIAREIIDYRYMKALSDKSKRWVTILSTERTLDEIIDLDASIGGRIKEIVGEYLITLTGEDKNYRLKGE